jgi:hypothetical protein
MRIPAHKDRIGTERFIAVLQTAAGCEINAENNKWKKEVRELSA